MYNADATYFVEISTSSGHPLTKQRSSIFVFAKSSNCFSYAITFSDASTTSDSSIDNTWVIPGPVKYSGGSSSVSITSSLPKTKSPPATSSMSIVSSSLQFERFIYYLISTNFSFSFIRWMYIFWVNKIMWGVLTLKSLHILLHQNHHHYHHQHFLFLLQILS